MLLQLMAQANAGDGCEERFFSIDYRPYQIRKEKEMETTSRSRSEYLRVTSKGAAGKGRPLIA